MTYDKVARGLRFLLLQVRNVGDPMREHEVGCFARALHCKSNQIRVVDLLAGAPPTKGLDTCDLVLLGGSGHYSATADEPWLHRTLEILQDVACRGKPLFASCWGFQAMARALGGRVVYDPANAELGTLPLRLTAAGLKDPIFNPLGATFRGQCGHEDHVVELPDNAVLLASSEKVKNQAYRLQGLPIYCTQFHPELRRDDLVARVRTYPEYMEKIAGIPLQAFIDRCADTPEVESLLLRFVHHVFTR